MMMLLALFLAAVWVAYANGANDNFKGVATLYGSGVASYRQALGLGTVATFAGCMASIVLAGELLRAFSGRGLVPDALAGTQPFLLAVACGAGATVMLATRLAFPVSTTHALTGALVGAGTVAAGGDVNFAALGKTFVLPLLLSPVVALLLTMVAQAVAARLTKRVNAKRDDCACLVEEFRDAPALQPGGAAALQQQTVMVGRVGRGADCVPFDSPQGVAAAAPTAAVGASATGTQPHLSLHSLQRGRVWGFTAQQALTAGHVGSAAVLCFARGLNDTPKIAALLLAAQATSHRTAMLCVAAAMAIGGLLSARKVAHTMSQGIATAMPDAPAFTANVVTSLLVIAASRFGLPVSTTHVSVGAITGLGITQGTLNPRVLRNVVMSWVVTLPLAVLLSALAWWAISTATSTSISTS